MIISIVVAMGENRVIGDGERMPWHLPADLAHFRKITESGVVIMGRRTFESIGKPLPRRVNIVLTKNADSFSKKWGVADANEKPAPGQQPLLFASSFEDALSKARSFSTGEVFVIGGENVYRAALGYAEKIYLTLVHGKFEGSVSFPELGSSWRMESETFRPSDGKNGFAMSFLVFKKLPENSSD